MQGALLSARDKRNGIKEIVEAYTDYEKRRKDETIVPDWRLIRCQTKLEVFAN